MIKAVGYVKGGGHECHEYPEQETRGVDIVFVVIHGCYFAV